MDTSQHPDGLSDNARLDLGEWISGPMLDAPLPAPVQEPGESAETTLIESARAVRADLGELAASLPGDIPRNALVAARLSEELAEVAEMLRSLPARPRQMSGHAYAALSAFRTAIVAGEDIGEFTAVTLARLAAELGGTAAVVANRPGSWEAGTVSEMLSGLVGPYDERLPEFGAGS